MTPVRPPNRNVVRKPTDHSIGVSKDRDPPHIVPIQLKNLMPVGTAIRKRHAREEGQVDRAGHEHVVRPHGDRQDRDAQRRADQADVAEDRFPAEHRQDLGDDPEERQRDDVDLWMAEEPEQVLPQDRATVRGVEHVGAELAVGLQGEQRTGQHGERDQHQQAGDQRVPDEDRHPEHGHARRAHADDRGDEVDRAQDGAQTGHPQAHDPEVTTDTRRTDRVGQRRIAGPPEGRGALRGEEPGGGDDAAEQEQPVAEHVQARERDVGRTDLQRHHRVAEAEEQRRREQQQHDRAVHREQLVVELVVDHLVAREGQLGAHQHRHHAGDQEPAERGGEVEVADHLVIGGGEDADDGAPQPPSGGR